MFELGYRLPDPGLPLLHISRRLLGVLALIAALAVGLALRLSAAAAPPVHLLDAVEGAVVAFSVDRSAVFAGGECVALAWQVEGIREVWLSLNPVTGQGEQTWCLPAYASYSTPVLRVKLVDESWREYPITIEVLWPVLLYTALPLAAAAVCLLDTGRMLPLALRPRLRLPSAVAVWFRGREGMLLAAVLVAVNGIVLVNAIRHNPAVGFDSTAHRRYIDTLAQFRLPTPEDTYEFFSPPLPYLIPAAVSAGLRAVTGCEAVDCSAVAYKTAQWQNVALSLGTTLLLLAISERLRPGDTCFKLLALALLGMLPVYYKTFSQVRGEPLVVFFTLALLDRLLAVFLRERAPTRCDALALGLSMGLLLLSRQWGAPVVLAAGVWALAALRRHPYRRQVFGVGLAALGIGALVGGWFYLSLQARYGSMLSFNRDPKGAVFSTAHHSAEFYFGLGGGRLFTYPYAPAYSGQMLPRFYTEMWGDYEGVFILFAAVPMPEYWISYLGRVNAVSLLPTLVLLAGLLAGAWHTLRTPARPAALPGWSAAASLAAYGWFIIRYPNIDGDTVKATYLLHVFPLLALLAAGWLAGLSRRHPAGYRGLVALLVIAALHNLPALFSRQTW